MTIRFEEPAPKPDAPPAAAPTPDVSSAAARRSEVPTAVDEVEVQGAPADPSRTQITILEAREVPGSFGDPPRAISALPGVSPMSGGSPFLYVRGAPPWNTGYLIDGVRVPILFHAGVATSVISPSLVQSVDFYPSAVPARYGGFVGGIIEERTTPPGQEPHAFVSAKLFEASALAESPFADGRGTALASFRYGYPQLVSAIINSSQSLEFWDYQARTTWSFDRSNRVVVFAFGSHDRSSESGVETLASDFHRLDVHYEHDFGDGTRVRVGSTAGWSRTGASPIYADDWMYAARAEADVPIAPSLLWRSGVQAQLDVYTQPQSPPGLPDSASPPPTNLTTGAYSDFVWHPSDRVELTPGVRFDLYHSARADPTASGTVPTLEPRVGLRVKITPDVAWLSSFGVSHEYPQLRLGVSDAALAVPGFQSGDVHLQTSGQVSEGLEFRLPAGVTLTTTGFASSTLGMQDLSENCYEQTIPPGAPMPGGLGVRYLCADQPANEVSYGAEVLLRRSLTERITGWLSYTLSRATETYTQPGQTGTVLSPFDRTHVLSAIGAYDLGAHWRVGARFTVYSGTPNLEVNSSGQRFAPIDGYRLPPFYRLDLRLEKRWNLARASWVSLVFDVMNATLSRETTRISCGPPDAPPGKCSTSSDPPVVIPSVGLEAGF